MKFEYDDSDRGECVAYIDDDGDLLIQNRNVDQNYGGAIYMTKEGNTGEYEEEFDENDAVVKFYPGDKITITF